MADTSRQSVTLTNPQRKVLEAEAKRLGISVSDLIRRIIDEWRLSK
ncbi:MAG: ribbon-helix-helix protein, CopG family [Rhodospirillales bacterium]|nr:ribbon-helix-helix protein, CopG family [Rhodospirillales bacterium]